MKHLILAAALFGAAFSAAFTISAPTAAAGDVIWGSTDVIVEPAPAPVPAPALCPYCFNNRCERGTAGQDICTMTATSCTLSGNQCVVIVVPG